MPEVKSRPSTAHDFNSTTFLELAQWVKRQLGIVFSKEQKEQFADRVRSFVAARQLTPESLLAALKLHDNTLSRELAEVVSTNYTFFMRESETFDFMRHNILPHLPEGPNRIWSAAASSGDEAYTVAMHAAEHFGTSAPERIRILGTDISQRQIAIAEAGSYPAEQLSLVDSGRRARFFAPAVKPGHLQVTKPLRELCTFRRMNLTHFPWPFENRFRIILLRNVLYYFEREMSARIIENCYEVAADGAWLLTSLTEPMLDVKTRWRRVAPAIYQKRMF